MSDNKGPTHRMYLLTGEDKPLAWNVGSVFPHKDDKGFNAKLEVIPREGRLILRAVDEAPPSLWKPSKTLTHKVYALLPRKDEKGDDDKFWLAVGGAYVHADGLGWNIETVAWPEDLQLVLREPKEEPPARKGYQKK